MFIAETVIFLLMFAFLLWQQWQLKKRLSSPAWNWKIAGYMFAFFGLLVRIGLTSIFDIPREWMLHVTFANSALSLGCLIRAMHLLHVSLERVLDQTLRARPKE